MDVRKAWLKKLVPKKGLTHPIFIISAPRTGSTFLFECLRRLRGVYDVGTEADRIWWSCFPYERNLDLSDYVGADEATPENVRRLRANYYWSAVGRRFGRFGKAAILAHSMLRMRIRYLDKTVANVFHLAFLERAFPGALYVHLLRDPCATISSMIEGWPHIQRFGKPQLTTALRACAGASIAHWTYPAPPGWRAVVTRPLHEICAWSWRQHTEHALAFFSRHGPPTATIRYEDLLADTPGMIKHLAKLLGLPVTPEALAYAQSQPLSRTVVSVPVPGKWREQNGEAITAVLPMISETAARIGYGVSGDWGL